MKRTETAGVRRSAWRNRAPGRAYPCRDRTQVPRCQPQLHGPLQGHDRAGERAAVGLALSACGTAGIHLSLPIAGEFDRVLGQPLCPAQPINDYQGQRRVMHRGASDLSKRRHKRERWSFNQSSGSSSEAALSSGTPSPKPHASRIVWSASPGARSITGSAPRAAPIPSRQAASAPSRPFPGRQCRLTLLAGLIQWDFSLHHTLMRQAPRASTPTEAWPGSSTG